MTTCKQILETAEVYAEDQDRPGWFMLNPPVKVLWTKRSITASVHEVNLEKNFVHVIGEGEANYHPEEFQVFETQGRLGPEEFTGAVLDRMEFNLNEIARETVRNGCGFVPTKGAERAIELLNLLRMRFKPALSERHIGFSGHELPHS